MFHRAEKHVCTVVHISDKLYDKSQNSIRLQNQVFLLTLQIVHIIALPVFSLIRMSALSVASLHQT